MDPIVFLGIVIISLAVLIAVILHIIDNVRLGFEYYHILQSEPNGDISKDHTAIIVVEYPKWHIIKNLFMYNSGLELLVRGLKKLDEPYAIYVCKSPEDFLKAISKSETKKIWILAHGAKHYVGFGKERLYYCECQDAPEKECIVQLHCNPYGGKSLADYLCKNKDNSFVSNDFRTGRDNKSDIKKILNKMKENKSKKN
jgi:hypothetical protein